MLERWRSKLPMRRMLTVARPGACRPAYHHAPSAARHVGLDRSRVGKPRRGNAPTPRLGGHEAASSRATADNRWAWMQRPSLAMKLGLTSCATDGHAAGTAPLRKARTHAPAVVASKAAGSWSRRGHLPTHPEVAFPSRALHDAFPHSARHIAVLFAAAATRRLPRARVSSA